MPLFTFYFLKLTLLSYTLRARGGREEIIFFSKGKFVCKRGCKSFVIIFVLRGGRKGKEGAGCVIFVHC